MRSFRDPRLELKRPGVFKVDSVKKRGRATLVARRTEETGIAITRARKLAPVDVVVTGYDDEPRRVFRQDSTRAAPAVD